MTVTGTFPYIYLVLVGLAHKLVRRQSFCTKVCCTTELASTWKGDFQQHMLPQGVFLHAINHSNRQLVH
jgi:hypothetical protein